MHICKLSMYIRKEGLQAETKFLQFALFLCRKISGIHSKSVNLYEELPHGNVNLNFSLRGTLC